MSKDSDCERGNSKPKDSKTILLVMHHALNQMFFNVGDIMHFFYSCGPKDINPRNILCPFQIFHLNSSRQSDLD